MNKKDIEKWVDNAEVNASVVYYSGNLAEDRCYDRNVAIIPNLFAEQAEKGRVDFFQKRKKLVSTFMVLWAQVRHFCLVCSLNIVKWEKKFTLII